MRTAWGYDVEGQSIPPLVTAEAFMTATGGRYDASRAETAILAASAAIRNACGWHISPSLSCSAELTASGRGARIPAAYVSSVSRVMEKDPASGAWTELAIPGDIEWSHNGVIRRRGCHSFAPALDGVSVEYEAGFDIGAASDLVQAVFSIAEGVLALPAGVSSESAGGVSVSYSSNAGSIAGALASGLQAQLAPYKVVGAHVA